MFISEQMEISKKVTAGAGNDKVLVAEKAYADQNYAQAVKVAAEAVLSCSESGDGYESTENIRKATGLIYDVLVSVWSSGSTVVLTGKDDVLKNAKYACDVLHTMRNEGEKTELAAEREQLEMIIGNLDETWKQGRKLSSDLRAKCNRNGREIDRKQTANILIKLALLYMRRAPDKVSLLHSSALLAAAIVRDPQSQDDILEHAYELDYLMLSSARAALRESSLFDISREIYDGQLARMRTKARASLKNIETMDGAENPDDTQKTEWANYVTSMEKLMTESAEDFTCVMREISDKCTKILGTPPCKFAHAAVGALPRKEITAHSKLESIILLDDDVKKSADYESILEYFRWYSVVFNVIIIYFGETPLHSIGIPCLNDFSFHNGSKDWFWDDVTPSGLQFNSILSIRRRGCFGSPASSDSSGGIELVKTTKDMVKLAEQKESWQNGCRLGEMMTRTCLIGGSKSLLKKFQKRALKVMGAHDKEKSAYNLHLQLMRDGLHNVSYENIIQDEEPDMKNVIYQTPKLFISAIGHMLHLEENPCFDIVKMMKHRGFLSDEGYHDLMLIIALACEVKLRIDADGNRVKDVIVSSYDARPHADVESTIFLNDVIGRWKILNFLLIVRGLQEAVKKISPRGALSTLKTLTFKTEDMVSKAAVFLHFGLYEEVLSITNAHDRSALSAPHNVLVYLLKGLANMKIGHHEDASENFNVCLALVLSLPEVDQPETPQCVQFCIGLNLLKKGKMHDAKEYFHQARNAYESNISRSDHCDKIYLTLLREIAGLHYRAGEYEQSLYESQALEARKGYADLSSNFAFGVKIIMANSLSEIGRHKESIAKYEAALKIHDDWCVDKSVARKSLNSSLMLHIVISLADCHFKVNNLELAERYCNDAIQTIRELGKSDQHDLAHVKLLLSQCYLKQNKHSKAAADACEACCIAFENPYPAVDRKKITRVAVTVIFRSLLPVRAGDLKSRQEHCQQDLRLTLDCAAQVLDIMNDESTFASGEMERDRSILIRVIQRGTFELGGYNSILEKCKAVFLFGKIDEEHPNFLQQLLSPVFKNPELRDNCKRDSERLIEIAKSCNIRDAISHMGALIIFVGWLFHLDRDEENWDELTEQLSFHLSQESDDIRVAILHCAVKVAIHVIDYYVSKIEDPSVLEDVKHRVVSLIDFATKLHTIVQSEASSSTSLVHESAVLINSIGSCWMRLKEYDAALEMFNEALSLQETLEGDEHISFKGTTAILENVAICLARLHRLDEAGGYLRRTMSMKDLRRKSRAFEDNTFLEVKVKSASCSFAVGNYQEAASSACEAFHDGLAMDSDRKRNESIFSAAQLVLKSALESSVHAQGDKNKHPNEVAQGILDSAITLRTTLKDRREQLGTKFSDLYDSLLYATANCHLALGQHKPALKCFKKTLKKLRSVGPCTRTEKSLLLHISKCLMGLEKYRKAARKLKEFLKTERNPSPIEHLHRSRAHNMIAVCLLKQHKYKEACMRAYKALEEAHGNCSTALFDKVATDSTAIFLETLYMLGDESILSID